MVHAHTPLVGQFAKSRAAQVIGPPLLRFVVLAMALIFACGFAMGFLLTSQVTGNHWWTLAGVAALGLIWFVGRTFLKRYDAVLDASVRRRVALMRGATAEVYVSCRFRDAFDDRWHLWDNLQLEGHGDIDHVLLGPGGLFVISTKARRGRFQSTPGDATSGGPRFNDEPTDWVSQALGQAVDVRKAMALMCDDPQAHPNQPPWAQAVLSLPFAHIDAPPAQDPDGQPLARSAPIRGVGKCWVLNDDDLLNAIAPEPIPKPRKLTQPDVDRWAAALQKLHERHAPPPDVLAETV